MCFLCVFFRVLDIDTWNKSSYVFDLIGCLNLLDRCNQPITMLHSMRASLRPVTGRVVVAVVLPFKPYVEVGKSWDRSFMGDPLSYFSFQPVLHDWCNKGRGMCYPICGMVHIKEPLLLIVKSSLCGGSGFPFSLSEWSDAI